MINTKPAEWLPCIMDIGERTIDMIEIYGNGALCSSMTREQRAVNRIWCKALERLLRGNKHWMAVEKNAVRLVLLSKFNQALCKVTAKTRWGNNRRTNLMYTRYLQRIQYGSVLGGQSGWSYPYGILKTIIFDADMILKVIGNDKYVVTESGLKILDAHVASENDKLERIRLWEKNNPQT